MQYDFIAVQLNINIFKGRMIISNHQIISIVKSLNNYCSTIIFKDLNSKFILYSKLISFAYVILMFLIWLNNF